VFEVASFYHHFDVVKEGDARPPRLTIRVCDSASCAMAGAEALISALEAHAGRFGEPARIQRVPCIGRCAEAPAAVVHQYPVAPATVEAVAAAVRDGRRDCPLPEQAVGLAQARAAGAYRQLAALV